MLAGDRWNALRSKGAAVQRLLWASTSIKNPLYDELHYIEPLVGPDTITTLTLKTLDAYRQHGRPRIRITDQIDHAMRRMSELEHLGISLPEACRKLEEDGIRHFVEPYEKVLETIRRKATSSFPRPRG
jgi:transaldolase